MAERLFSLLRKERRRLEQLIADAETAGRGQLEDVQRLKALRRAVDYQIESWARDLGGHENYKPLRAA